MPARANMTPAGPKSAIPGSVSQCLTHWATEPLVRNILCMLTRSPIEQDARACARALVSVFVCVCAFACACAPVSQCVVVCVCAAQVFAGLCAPTRETCSMTCVLRHHTDLALRPALLHCPCAWSAFCVCSSQRPHRTGTLPVRSREHILTIQRE